MPSPSDASPSDPPALPAASSLPPLSIVKYPHPALRWPSKPVAEIDARLREAVRRMFDLMYEANGIGLAANQVALPWRLFVINPTGDRAQADQEFVFLNPEILRRKGSEEGEEGCLSLPALFGPVPRAAEIVVEAFDLEGESFQMDLDDLPARVVQHETDHLDGVLFIDRMAPGPRRELDAKLADFESDFRREQAAGYAAGDEELRRRLRELEPASG